MNQTPIRINPKFKDLLPPLTSDEMRGLTESCLAEGINDSLVCWAGEGYLVDGHNRLEIAVEHGLDYRVEEKEFADETEVMAWIIARQLSRRNIEPNIRALMVGRLYELRKQSRGGDRVTTSEKIDTAAEVAAETGVSPRTVVTAGKVAKAFDEADPETKEQFTKGKVSQKELLKKNGDAPKPKEPRRKLPGGITQDEFTAAASSIGLRLQNAITKLQDLCGEAANVFKEHGQELRPFAPHLAKFRITSEELDAEAYSLKQLVVCPHVREDTDNCMTCKGTGYASAEDAAALRVYEEGRAMRSDAKAVAKADPVL